MAVLKNIPINELKNSILWHRLSDLPFIRINEGRFISARNCYDDHFLLFRRVFSDYILPYEYRNDEWKPFMLELGLKHGYNVENIMDLLRQLFINLRNSF